MFAHRLSKNTEHTKQKNYDDISFLWKWKRFVPSYLIFGRVNLVVHTIMLQHSVTQISLREANRRSVTRACLNVVIKLFSKNHPLFGVVYSIRHQTACVKVTAESYNVSRRTVEPSRVKTAQNSQRSKASNAVLVTWCRAVRGGWSPSVALKHEVWWRLLYKLHSFN
jgi:hypothetical protein